MCSVPQPTENFKMFIYADDISFLMFGSNASVLHITTRPYEHQYAKTTNMAQIDI